MAYWMKLISPNFFPLRERSGKYLFYVFLIESCINYEMSCYKQTDVLCKMCVKLHRFDF